MLVIDPSPRRSREERETQAGCGWAALRFVAPVALGMVMGMAGADAGATVLHVPDGPPSIRAALEVANDGDLIVVHPGTYWESGLEFGGKAVTVRGIAPANGAVVAATVVRGDGTESVFVFGDGEGPGSGLEGLTITGGRGEERLRSGGGITCGEGSSPRVTHCVIRGNQGSGVYCYQSAPLFENCELVNNQAQRGGGVAIHRGAAPVFRHCRIAENQALGAGGIECRGFIEPVRPLFESCAIVDNQATFDGGGAVCLDSGATVELRGCTLTGNQAVGLGGAIENRGTLVATNCVWRGNQAGAAGGAIYSYSVLRVDHCTFYANLSATQGGAVYATGWESLLDNSVFWADSPEELYLDSGAEVTYCDVAGGAWGIGNIDAEPLLGEAAGLELVPLPGSPCLDAGHGAADGVDLCELRVEYCSSPTRRPDLGAYGGPENLLWRDEF